MSRTFTENDFQNLKIEIEDFKSKNPNLIKNPNIIYLSFASDAESQSFTQQVTAKFQQQGIEIRYISAINVGEMPKKNFSISNWIDDSLLIEIHPEF